MRTLFLILAVAFLPFLPAQAQNYVESDLDGAESDRLSFGMIYRF